MTDTVNSQITDSVTQTGVSVLGGASAQSMGVVYQSMAHAISLLMQNSVSSQGGMQQINAAVVASACKQILTASTQRMSSLSNQPQLAPGGGQQHGTSSPHGDNQNGDNQNGDNQKGNSPDDKPKENVEQKLKKVKEQAKNSLQEAVDAAKKAADAESEALQAADLIINQDLDSQEKVKQVFGLAQDASRASKNASVALVQTQSSAAKAQDASDLDMATQYAKQTEELAKQVKEAAKKAEDAATKAEDIATAA